MSKVETFGIKGGAEELYKLVSFSTGGGGSLKRCLLLIFLRDDDKNVHRDTKTPRPPVTLVMADSK